MKDPRDCDNYSTLVKFVINRKQSNEKCEINSMLAEK